MSWVAVGAAGVGTLTGVVKGFRKKKLGKEQMGRSQELRDEAALVKKPQLRQEFKDVQKLKALQVLTGMPGLEAAKDELALDGANALQEGREGSRTGGDYLDYASKLYSGIQEGTRDLQSQQAQYKVKNFGEYADALWDIGQEEKTNEAIQRQQQDQILQQASALEDSATANKYQGGDEIVGAIGTGAAQGLAAYGTYRDSDEFKLKRTAKLLDKQASGKQLSTKELLQLNSYGQGTSNSDNSDDEPKWYDHVLSSYKQLSKSSSNQDLSMLPADAQQAIKLLMKAGLSYDEAYEVYQQKSKR